MMRIKYTIFLHPLIKFRFQKEPLLFLDTNQLQKKINMRLNGKNSQKKKEFKKKEVILI